MPKNIFESMRQDEREKEVARIVSGVTNARAAATALGLDSLLKENLSYYLHQQDIKCKKYNEWRYSKSFEDIETIASILIANKPVFTYGPEEPLDTYLVEVVNAAASHVLYNANYDLVTAYRIKDELLNGTTFVEWFVEDGNLLCENVPLHEMILADWTERSMRKQPFIARVKLPSRDWLVKEFGEEVASQVDPGDGLGLLAYLERTVESFKSLAGFDRIFSKKEMQSEWKRGRVVCLEHQEIVNGRVERSYIVNGMPLGRQRLEWEWYPVVKYCHLPRHGSALGIAINEYTRHDSDAITVMVQNFLRHQAAAAGGIFLYPTGSGINSNDIEKAINGGIVAIACEPKYMQMANGALQMIKRDAYSPGLTQGMQLVQGLVEGKGGSTRYLAGLPVSGEDSASKVKALQNAGMGRLKLQAQFDDLEGTRQSGEIVLKYIKDIMTDEMVFRAVNETDADGNPKFYELNMEVDQNELLDMMEQATLKDEGATVRNTDLSADDIIGQAKLIARSIGGQIEKRAYLNGQVPKFKLNDPSVGKFDIRVNVTDFAPLQEAERKNTALALGQLQKISDKELRDATGWATDPKSMSELRPKGAPIQEYMQALEKAPAGTPEHDQIMQKLLMDYAVVSGQAPTEQQGGQ